MANVSEQPLSPDTLSSLEGASRESLGILGLTETADTQQIIDAIDAFVFAWQDGERPLADVVDPEDAPFALGSLWGNQLVRRFGWEWAIVTFHDHGDSTAPGVLSPDRSLAIYPIHFLIGALRDPAVDVTIALSYNMLVAGNVGELVPRSYLNWMDVVFRIVPRR